MIKLKRKEKYIRTYTERTARFCDKDDYFFDEKSKADFALDMCLLRKVKTKNLRSLSYSEPMGLENPR